MLVCVSSHNFAHETAGAARIRHSPRPLITQGAKIQAQPGQIAPRDREGVSDECEHAALSAVIARAGGRSSIPETPVIESRSRSVLDTPHARGMTNLASLRGAQATKQS